MDQRNDGGWRRKDLRRGRESVHHCEDEVVSLKDKLDLAMAVQRRYHDLGEHKTASSSISSRKGIEVGLC